VGEDLWFEISTAQFPIGQNQREPPPPHTRHPISKNTVLLKGQKVLSGFVVE